jgi:Uma2 family endonuclease
MTTAAPIAPKTAIVEPPTLRDLVDRLGDVALSRILAQPAPGIATEADLMEATRRYGRLYELVDGVLVEKGMGFGESLLACALIQILRNFVIPRNLGIVSGPDGTIRLFSGLTRIPDVTFASWDRFPDRRIPAEPIPSLAPDLVIEMLSESNTRAEMERKRSEYFAAGVNLIWEFDPRARVVVVYARDGSISRLDASQSLDGGNVLPGFTLKIGEVFAELDRHG